MSANAEQVKELIEEENSHLSQKLEELTLSLEVKPDAKQFTVETSNSPTIYYNYTASKPSVFQELKALENNLRDNQHISFFTPLTFTMEDDQVVPTVVAALRKVEDNVENWFNMNDIEKECEAPHPMKIRGYRLFQLKNGEKWVQKCGLERFFGYQYLNQVINYYNLQTLRVAPKKFTRYSEDINISVKESQGGFRTIDSRNYFIFSKFIPNKLETFNLTPKEDEEINFINSKGYTDLFGYVNIRRGEDGLLSQRSP